jgi:hypothetical protein
MAWWGWRRGSRGGAPTLQAPGPEFKPHSHQTNKQKGLVLQDVALGSDKPFTQFLSQYGWIILWLKGAGDERQRGTLLPEAMSLLPTYSSFGIPKDLPPTHRVIYPLHESSEEPVITTAALLWGQQVDSLKQGSLSPPPSFPQRANIPGPVSASARLDDRAAYR